MYSVRLINQSDAWPIFVVVSVNPCDSTHHSVSHDHAGRGVCQTKFASRDDI